MRPFLVTKFFCSECGGELGVEYEKNVKKTTTASDPRIVDRDEPTGADMVRCAVYVSPCYNCLKPARDAKKLADNLKAMIGE